MTIENQYFYITYQWTHQPSEKVIIDYDIWVGDIAGWIIEAQNYGNNNRRLLNVVELSKERYVDVGKAIFGDDWDHELSIS